MSGESPSSVVPEDFPREGPTVSIAGVQPKIAARFIDGKYVVGWTPEELRERYESCEDLARQLASYCTRKALENPDWAREFNLQRTARGMSEKVTGGHWDVTKAEQLWIMERVRHLLGW
jgi:hypothetical protein